MVAGHRWQKEQKKTKIIRLAFIVLYRFYLSIVAKTYRELVEKWSNRWNPKI